MAWSQHGIGIGIAIIGALRIHGGGTWRVPCSCSCPLSFPPSLAPGSPETGGHCDIAATHCLWRTGRLGGASSQPAGRTKIPSLQLALPSISGHSFLMIPLDLSPIARTGALGQPTSLLPQYHSTGTSIQGSCRQGWVWGKRILLVYSRCTHSLMSALSARHPSSHAATWPPRSSIRSSVWSPCMPKSSRHLPLSLGRRLRLAQIQAGAVVVVDEGGGRQKSRA